MKPSKPVSRAFGSGLSLSGLVVSTLLVALPALAAESPEAGFRALTEREWQWALEQSPLLATYAGDFRNADRLGCSSDPCQRERARHYRATLAELAKIDPASLPAAAQVDYTIFRAQLESNAENIELDGHYITLNSDSAFYSDLLNLHRAHRFETLADYETYLKRLDDLPRWFDEQQDLMARGLKTGMTVPQVVLQGRDVTIAREAERSDPATSPYYAPFKELPATFSEQDRTRLQLAAQTTIRKKVTPAYAKLLRFMREKYMPGARKTLGAEQMPNGKAFYRRQIIDYTTLDLTPDAIHATGLAEVKRIRADMEAIVAELKFEGDFAAFLKFLRTDPQFYPRTGEELLMNAAWIAKRIDAQLPKYFNVLPRRPFGIQPVPEAIAPYYTAGRYAGPPEGSNEPGYYWVNTTKLESRPLYNLPALTLHEAVPGHHLQGALALEQGTQPPFRRLSYISAFGEGWALYAEYLGKEMGIYRTPYEHFGRLTYEMWRACRLVVDTGVHAKGWTREQALAFLRDNTALSEHEITTEVDRYISWPGQALSYKLGEMKIRELRGKAEHELGAKFDLRAFHDTILAMGSVPLPILEQQIDAFIASRR